METKVLRISGGAFGFKGGSDASPLGSFLQHGNLEEKLWFQKRAIWLRFLGMLKTGQVAIRTSTIALVAKYEITRCQAASLDICDETPLPAVAAVLATPKKTHMARLLRAAFSLRPAIFRLGIFKRWVRREGSLPSDAPPAALRRS